MMKTTAAIAAVLVAAGLTHAQAPADAQAADRVGIRVGQAPLVMADGLAAPRRPAGGPAVRSARQTTVTHDDITAYNNDQAQPVQPTTKPLAKGQKVEAELPPHSASLIELRYETAFAVSAGTNASGER